VTSNSSTNPEPCECGGLIAKLWKQMAKKGLIRGDPRPRVLCSASPPTPLPASLRLHVARAFGDSGDTTAEVDAAAAAAAAAATSGKGRADVNEWWQGVAEDGSALLPPPLTPGGRGSGFVSVFMCVCVCLIDSRCCIMLLPSFV
jgi:hypothetical protein